MPTLTQEINARKREYAREKRKREVIKAAEREARAQAHGRQMIAATLFRLSAP